MNVDYRTGTVLNDLGKKLFNPQNYYFNCIITHYPIIILFYRDRN